MGHIFRERMEFHVWVEQAITVIKCHPKLEVAVLKTSEILHKNGSVNSYIVSY